DAFPESRVGDLIADGDLGAGAIRVRRSILVREHGFSPFGADRIIGTFSARGSCAARCRARGRRLFRVGNSLRGLEGALTSTGATLDPDDLVASHGDDRGGKVHFTLRTVSENLFGDADHGAGLHSGEDRIKLGSRTQKPFSKNGKIDQGLAHSKMSEPVISTLRISLLDAAKAAPTDPGVYLMKDATGTILYVGKAKNLKNRLTSYFQGAMSGTPHEIPRIE